MGSLSNLYCSLPRTVSHALLKYWNAFILSPLKEVAKRMTENIGEMGGASAFSFSFPYPSLHELV